MCYFPRHSFSTSVSLLAEGHVTFCLKRWFSEPAERAHIVFPKAHNVSVLIETCGMVLICPGQQSLSWSYRNHLLSLGRSLSLLHIQSLIEGSATSPRVVSPVEDFMSSANFGKAAVTLSSLPSSPLSLQGSGDHSEILSQLSVIRDDRRDLKMSHLYLYCKSISDIVFKRMGLLSRL